MGEARRRQELGGPPNGHFTKMKRLRVVPNIHLENVEADRVVMLMIGDRQPELATAMRPPEVRKLIEALTKHLEALERDAPRIIIPGIGDIPHGG